MAVSLTWLRPSRSRARRALRVSWLALRLVVVLGVVALALAWRVFGYTPLVVQSGSMEPNLPVGAMLFVKEVDPGTVREGDVITFDPPGPAMRTTHRVADVIMHEGDPYFVTKGDANDEVDDWRRSADAGSAPTEPINRAIGYGDNQALRVAGHVPWIGYATVVAAHGWFRLAIIAAVTCWLMFAAVRWIWRPPLPRASESAALPAERKSNDGVAPA